MGEVQFVGDSGVNKRKGSGTVAVPKINRDGKGDSRPVSHSSLVTPEIFNSTKHAS